MAGRLDELVEIPTPNENDQRAIVELLVSRFERLLPVQVVDVHGGAAHRADDTSDGVGMRTHSAVCAYASACGSRDAGAAAATAPTSCAGLRAGVVRAFVERWGPGAVP